VLASTVIIDSLDDFNGLSIIIIDTLFRIKGNSAAGKTQSSDEKAYCDYVLKVN